MSNYVFNEEDVIPVAALGIKKCTNCNKYVHQELDINIKTHDKYRVCTNCFKVTDILDKEFNALLIYSKLVPQNLVVTSELWLKIIDFYYKNAMEFMDANPELSPTETLDELVKEVINEININDEYNEIFLDQIARDAFMFFIDKVNELNEDKYLNGRKKTENKSERKRKKSINQIMKTDYQNTIYNILNKKADLFDNCYGSIEFSVNEYSNKAEYYSYDEKTDDKLYAIRLVKIICMMYQQIQEQNEITPMKEEYIINREYTGEIIVNGLNSRIDFKKGFGLFSDNNNIKTQVATLGFSAFLKDIESKKLIKYTGEKIKYLDLISTFVKNKDYQYNEDLALALFIFENYSTFKEYIPDEYYAKSFVEQLKNEEETE